MIKRGIAILLCFAYLTGTCAPLLPYINYAVNKNYIAANLCENRSKPEMHCEGRCFIGKEIIHLAKQQESSGKNEQQVQHNEFFPHELQRVILMGYFETKVVLQADELFVPKFSTSYGQPDIPPEILG